MKIKHLNKIRYLYFSFIPDIISKGGISMISYSGLLQKLNDKNLTKTALTTELGISSRTVAKIGRGEKIADHVLAKIATFLDCAAF